MAEIDLSLGLKGTHVLVTGGAGHIGSAVVQAFLSAGAIVSAVDIDATKIAFQHPNLRWQVADVTSESEMERVFDEGRDPQGVLPVCVALAGLDLSYIPQHASICDMSVEQWRRTHRVNVEGTFITARAWLRQIRKSAVEETRNIGLIIMGSESGIFGQSSAADYSSSKSAIQYGLVRSLAKDVVNIHPRARVNAIAPGPVDTPQFKKECADNKLTKWLDAQATVAMKVPVPMEAVARACLFLASETWSGNITGQLLPVDSGKSGKVHWLFDEVNS